MGTWGTSIFDDDIAMDIKFAFEELKEEGLEIDEITDTILEDYEDEIEDVDEGAIIFLALVALQIQYNALQENIKEKALSIIEKGQGLERWEEAGEEALTERKKVLEALKQKIVSN